MWCRPPHGFFFTSSDAATAFAAAIGTELELAPIAIASKELVSAEGIAAMRDLDVTRIFVDPRSTPRAGTSSAPSCASPRPRPSSNGPILKGISVLFHQAGGRKTLALSAARPYSLPDLKTELSVYFSPRSTSDGRGTAGESAHRSSRNRDRRRLDDRQGRRRRSRDQGDPLERLPAPPDQAGGEGARLPRARSSAAFPNLADASSPHLHHRLGRGAARPAHRREVRPGSERGHAGGRDTCTPTSARVFELGGQDAKIIIFKKNEETGDKTAITSMNDKCASGTGATIDKCVIKVGLPNEEVVQDRASTTRSCTTSPPSAACSPRPTSSTW